MYECGFVSDLNPCPYRVGALCSAFGSKCGMQIQPPTKEASCVQQKKYVRKERWYEKYYEQRAKSALEKKKPKEESDLWAYDKTLDPFARPKSRKDDLDMALTSYFAEFGEPYPANLSGRIDSAFIIKDIYERIRKGEKK